MSNQSDLQQWVRDQTGTTLDYNGDWHALFDQSAIPAGDLNGRMLSWLNAQLGVTYDNLPGAQNAYAISCGVDNWNSLSQGVRLGPELIPSPTFDASTGWTLQAGWSISAGELHAISAAANSFAQSPSIITAGKRYRISLSCKAFTAGGFKILLEGGANVFGDQTTVGNFTGDVTATISGSIYVWSNSTLTADFDDCFVREIL